MRYPFALVLLWLPLGFFFFFFLYLRICISQKRRSSLKSKLFFNFPTKAALCVINFTTDKSKKDKPNANYVEHVFRFSLSVYRSRVFQVSFSVECFQIPNLAAGQLHVLQQKPSRQVAVVCYCVFFGVGRNLDFGLSCKCFVTIKVHRSPRFWQTSSWPSINRLALYLPHPSPGCHTLHFIIIIMTIMIIIIIMTIIIMTIICFIWCYSLL